MTTHHEVLSQLAEQLAEVLPAPTGHMPPDAVSLSMFVWPVMAPANAAEGALALAGAVADAHVLLPAAGAVESALVLGPYCSHC